MRKPVHETPWDARHGAGRFLASLYMTYII